MEKIVELERICNRCVPPALRINQELAARSCEMAIWQAILGAQLAGHDGSFVADLIALHADAGDRRRRLEASH